MTLGRSVLHERAGVFPPISMGAGRMKRAVHPLPDQQSGTGGLLLQCASHHQCRCADQEHHCYEDHESLLLRCTIPRRSIAIFGG